MPYMLFLTKLVLAPKASRQKKKRREERRQISYTMGQKVSHQVPTYRELEADTQNSLADTQRRKMQRQFEQLFLRNKMFTHRLSPHAKVSKAYNSHPVHMRFAYLLFCRFSSIRLAGGVCSPHLHAAHDDGHTCSYTS